MSLPQTCLELSLLLLINLPENNKKLQEYLNYLNILLSVCLCCSYPDFLNFPISYLHQLGRSCIHYTRPFKYLQYFADVNVFFHPIIELALSDFDGIMWVWMRRRETDRQDVCTNILNR